MEEKIKVSTTQEKHSKILNGDNAFHFCNFLFMAAFVTITLYPVLNTVCVAFNDGTDAARGGLLIFKSIHLLNFLIRLHMF